MVNETREPAASGRFGPSREGAGLSDEGAELARDVRAQLETWIDENVDRLEAEMLSAIEARQAALAVEVTAFEQEIGTSRRQMSELTERLDALERSFEGGDGILVDEAVRATKETVQSVRAALEEHERRVRDLALTATHH